MRTRAYVHLIGATRGASGDVREEREQDRCNFLSPLIVIGVVCGIRYGNAPAEEARRDLWSQSES